MEVARDDEPGPPGGTGPGPVALRGLVAVGLGDGGGLLPGDAGAGEQEGQGEADEPDVLGGGG